jgi:ABC-type transport system substrate-binding protein
VKIRARVASYATKEIEVDFPCYVKVWDVFDSGGGYEKYIRYEADGTFIKITEHDRSWIAESWEFQRDTIRGTEKLRDALGYHLIEHDNRSTAEEFYKKLDEMILMLDTVPR